MFFLHMLTLVTPVPYYKQNLYPLNKKDLSGKTKDAVTCHNLDENWTYRLLETDRQQKGKQARIAQTGAMQASKRSPRRLDGGSFMRPQNNLTETCHFCEHQNSAALNDLQNNTVYTINLQLR